MVVDREAITILQNAAHEALKNNLEEILTDARPRLLRQAQRQGLTPDIAEDIAQETLIEAWRSLEHLQTPENLHAWLHGICRNVCLRWWKASNKSGQYVSSPFTTLECW